MKRSHPSPSPGAGNSEETTTTTRTVRKPMDSAAYFHKYQMGMARYFAAKADSLKQPLSFGDGKSRFMPLPKGFRKSIPQAEFKKIMAEYEGATKTGCPLDGDAITAILKQTKPHCPKAQAWIRAHEYSKKIQKEMEEKSHDRDIVRKKAIHKLRQKTLWSLRMAGASREEVQEVLDVLPPAHLCELTEEEQEKANQLQGMRWMKPARKPSSKLASVGARGSKSGKASSKALGKVVDQDEMLREIAKGLKF